MIKKEIIKHLRSHMITMPKQSIGNLLDSWEGRTPKLWCEPSKDCVDCRFPEDRICDYKDCDSRMISAIYSNEI